MKEQRGLQILDAMQVSGDPSVVAVDVYGGPDNACGTVSFSMPCASDARQAVGLIIRWRDDGCTVRMVDDGAAVTLYKEDEQYGQFQ